MASPRLLGWAVSEVTCKDTVRLPPGMFKQLAPTCTSYGIPPTSKQIPTSLGTREKRKERCAYIPSFHGSQVTRMCRKAQQRSGNSESQKTTGWGCGTLGSESETVCVNSATFLCQPSVLRQRRKEWLGSLLILTTLAPSEGPLLQQRSPAVPCMCCE